MIRVTEPFSYRDDSAVPTFPDDRPIIIYDGKCRLCSGFVRFVLRHDRSDCFRFIAAQSPLGTALYRHYDLDQVDYETNILLEQGRPWFKSEGSIRMFASSARTAENAGPGRSARRSFRAPCEQDAAPRSACSANGSASSTLRKPWSSRAIVFGWCSGDGAYSEFHFRPGWHRVQTATKLNTTAGSGFMWR